MNDKVLAGRQIFLQDLQQHFVHCLRMEDGARQREQGDDEWEEREEAVGRHREGERLYFSAGQELRAGDGVSAEALEFSCRGSSSHAVVEVCRITPQTGSDTLSSSQICLSSRARCGGRGTCFFWQLATGNRPLL